VFVGDDGVPADQSDRWLARLVALDHGGGLTPAGVGLERRLDPGVRDDRTAFADLGWDDLVGWFDALGAAWSAGLRVALPRMSVQLAAFDPGGHYDPHYDAFAGDPSRRLSAVLWLDRTWTADDGGALAVRVGGATREVVPVGGRLVVFRSDAVEHAVLPPRRTRYAVAGWFGTAGRIDRR
jgi:SM-20-related protein